ncbi:MAG: MerR family transcriptional regulator [Acidobacteriota bacterium]
MAQEHVVIPEKIYFKIGEVCDLVGVQAHVLRYWETEFSVLSPQKNKSGQRSYRRRDVEIALRIKQLLYNEMFTIAGARKKIQSEHRDGSKPKQPTTTPPQPATRGDVEAPTLFDNAYEAEQPVSTEISDVKGAPTYSSEQRDALKTVAAHLLELRDMLKTSRV